MPSYVDAINQVLAHEGGFVNNPLDRGGATNYGITQSTYDTYMRQVTGNPNYKSSVAEIQSMPVGNAIQIYKKNFWDAINGDKIKRYTIAYAIFDQGVNFGPTVAVKRAQKLLGLSQDGQVGATTLAALNAVDEKKFMDSFLAASKDAYNAIVSKNPSQSVFINGWMARVNSIQNYVSGIFGSINATTVGVGVGIIVVAGVAGFFLWRLYTARQGVMT